MTDKDTIPGFSFLAAFAGVLITCLCAFADNMAFEWNTQGVASYNSGQYTAAVDCFTKAMQLEPGNPTIRHNLCNAHQAAANELAKVADFAAAARHLESAIAADPENASPLVQLGSYYLRLDMVDDGILRLERAIEIAPHNVDAHDVLGDAYYMDNDIASARVQWEWVLQKQPDRPGLKQKLEKATREESVESNFRPSGSRHFELTYSPEMPGRSLRVVLGILEQAYVTIGRNFGNVYPPGPIQVIIYNDQGFKEATQQGAHVGGLYDGKIRIPLTEADGSLLPEQELRERLFHEFTHVVVRFLGGKNVPWWLNEGLAEAFSRELSPAQEAFLQKAAEDGMLFPLSKLEGNQLDHQSPDVLRLAYAQSHVTVAYLWRHFGQGRLADLMSNLAEGITPEEALYKNYRRNYDSLYKEVLRSLLRE